MKILYWSLAGIIFLFHVALGIFYLVGWYFDEVQIIYWILMSFWIGSWVILGYCPVSKAEFLLREKYDPSIDTNTEIIKHYLKRLFGLQIKTSTILKTGLVVFLFLVGLSVIF